MTYWLKVCFIFSPAKVTLLGSIIFTFQHTEHLQISRHDLVFLYTMFLVVTKVRVQSSNKSVLQILCNQNSAYEASNRYIYFLLLLQSKMMNFGEFIQQIHDFLKLISPDFSFDLCWGYQERLADSLRVYWRPESSENSQGWSETAETVSSHLENEVLG